MNATVIVPFRWDVSRREQLGRLADGPCGRFYYEFFDDLRRCCAEVLAAAGDCDLLFVGRSPESLFDYLRGACAGTPWADRLHLLLFSLRGLSEAEAHRAYREGVLELRRYLAALGLDPAALPRRARPAALVDLVSSGETFENLLLLLRRWFDEERGDWKAARHKIRVVGITEREPPRPAGDSWRSGHAATRLLSARAVRDIRVPARLWRYLGDDQEKVAESYPPDRWGRPRAARPPVLPAARAPAVRLARVLFELASMRGEREALVADMARAGALRVRECRRLVAHLRGTGGGGGRPPPPPPRPRPPTGRPFCP